MLINVSSEDAANGVPQIIQISEMNCLCEI
jgi:hypothetical protein